MMEEQWLPVISYEGWYDISDLGRVRRMRSGGGSFAGKILKPSVDNRGYLNIDLYKNGKNKICAVHRLVTEAFIRPYKKGFETNHIDGDKTNNRLDNLEIVTSSQNKKHAFKIGLMSARGERNSQSKLTENDVRAIIKMLPECSQTSIGKKFGVAPQTINNIVKGRSWAYIKEEEEKK